MVERIYRIRADADETGERTGYSGRAREIVARAAGEGAVAIAVVRAGAVREVRVDIVFVDGAVLIDALKNDRGVVDDADVECARRQDKGVIGSIFPTDRTGEIEIHSLFENSLLVQRICR